jgi:hypothetical protein
VHAPGSDAVQKSWPILCGASAFEKFAQEIGRWWRRVGIIHHHHPNRRLSPASVDGACLRRTSANPDRRAQVRLAPRQGVMRWIMCHAARTSDPAAKSADSLSARREGGPAQLRIRWPASVSGCASLIWQTTTFRPQWWLRTDLRGTADHHFKAMSALWPASE